MAETSKRGDAVPKRGNVTCTQSACPLQGVPFGMRADRIV